MYKYTHIYIYSVYTINVPPLSKPYSIHQGNQKYRLSLRASQCRISRPIDPCNLIWIVLYPLIQSLEPKIKASRVIKASSNSARLTGINQPTVVRQHIQMHLRAWNLFHFDKLYCGLFPIGNESALGQVMIWRQTVNKWLPKLMLMKFVDAIWCHYAITDWTITRTLLGETQFIVSISYWIALLANIIFVYTTPFRCVKSSSNRPLNLCTLYLKYPSIQNGI